MRRDRAAWIAPLTLACVGELSACDGCHSKKPYTPYRLSDGPPASTVPPGGSAAPPAGSASTGPLPDVGPAFSAVLGTTAPRDGYRWPLGSGSVDAPPGRTFGTGLTVDADGDGTPDLFAWTKASDSLHGELWFWPGSNPGIGRAVVSVPADVLVQGCTATPALTQVGPRTAVLDFDPRCPARVRAKAVHWVAVLRLQPAGSPPEVALDLRIGGLYEGESVHVAADTRDRDGDGRNDFTATLTLSGAPQPFPPGGSASATLAFFDRPAGLSRDPVEPQASLKALASGLIAEGRRKTTAPRVGPDAAATRRLYSLLCEEAGKPTVVTTAGPVPCGDTRRLPEDATVAEIEAALNVKDPIAALAALGRLDALSPRRKDIEALVAKHVPTIPGLRVRTTVAVPLLQPSLSYGAVAFAAGGDLLVGTRTGLVRVDRVSFDELATEPDPAWSPSIAWSPGKSAPTWKLTRVEERCEAPFFVGHFEAADRSTDVPLPVTPTGARCVPSPRVSAEPLGSTAQGALLAVRGDILAFPTDDPPRALVAESLAALPGHSPDLGVSRSPDGTVLALPTSRGILVALLKGTGRAATARLWSGPTADGAVACVPSNGGDRIACATSAGVAVYDAK